MIGLRQEIGAERAITKKRARHQNSAPPSSMNGLIQRPAEVALMPSQDFAHESSMLVAARIALTAPVSQKNEAERGIQVTAKAMT